MNVKFTFNRDNVSQSTQPGLKAHVQYVSKVVDSPAPAGTGAKSITANGTYYAISEGLVGYNVVDVDVAGGGGSTLIEKTVNANGVYNASSDSADGYSKVTVSVPASAVDTGTKSISTNGTHDVIGYASANVSVPASAVDTGTKSITANGTGIDVIGYAAVDVAVPNTYAAGDEGKVVSNGALVSQTAHAEVTQNGTIDTTLNNSVTVNVSGGGGSGLEYEEGTYTAASDSIPTITFTNTHTEAPALVVLMDASDTYINTTAGTMYGFMDFTKLFGVGLKTGPALVRAGCYSHAKSSNGGTTTLGAAVLADPSTQATNTGFTPDFSSATYMCKAGQTYKWIAIWR